MDPSDAKAATEQRPMCDHICLKDDGHVERGEPHFYGYELPSPRKLAAERDVVQAENQRLTTENERLERMLAGTNVRWSEKLHEAERKERERLTEEYGRMQMALVELLPERDCLARQVNAATDGLRDLLEGALAMRSYVPDHFAEKWDHDSYIERATAVLAPFTTTEETPA